MPSENFVCDICDKRCENLFIVNIQSRSVSLCGECFKKRDDPAMAAMVLEKERIKNEAYKKQKQSSRNVSQSFGPYNYPRSNYGRFSLGGLEREYINKYKLYYLFHFTHKNNIGFILEKGLLPKNQLAAGNNQYVSIADEEVQAKRANIEFNLMGRIRRALHDCVPLYISWRTPTLYRVLHKGDVKESDIVHILVNAYSVLKKNYCFTDGNAASIYTSQYVLIQNLDKLDWSVIKSDDWGGDNEKIRKKNAEFLVYPKVEVRDFYKLIVADQDAKEEIDTLLRSKNIKLEVEVDKRYYEWPKMY